jgi:hypothetical protein
MEGANHLGCLGLVCIFSDDLEKLEDVLEIGILIEG